MAFESMARVKELQERLVTRMHNFRKRAEKSMGQAILVVEVNGALAGWGYANERWGDPPADDPNGLREHSIMNVPTDLAVGIGMLGVSMFGGLGKYEEHGINIGTGSTGAFSYRLGAVAGRKAAVADAQGKPAKTAGQPAQVGQGGARMPAGKQHHVQYAA
jgi:hypothetical protein